MLINYVPQLKYAVGHLLFVPRIRRCTASNACTRLIRTQRSGRSSVSQQSIFFAIAGRRSAPARLDMPHHAEAHARMACGCVRTVVWAAREPLFNNHTRTPRGACGHERAAQTKRASHFSATDAIKYNHARTRPRGLCGLVSWIFVPSFLFHTLFCGSASIFRLSRGAPALIVRTASSISHKHSANSHRTHFAGHMNEALCADVHTCAAMNCGSVRALAESFRRIHRLRADGVLLGN